jgi:hypothetical protein
MLSSSNGYALNVVDSNSLLLSRSKKSCDEAIALNCFIGILDEEKHANERHFVFLLYLCNVTLIKCNYNYALLRAYFSYLDPNFLFRTKACFERTFRSLKNFLRFVVPVLLECLFKNTKANYALF